MLRPNYSQKLFLEKIAIFDFQQGTI